MLSKDMEALWDGFSDDEKQAIETRFAHLRDEYLTLQEIRKHKNITQESVAKLLGIKQENVSRMERRDDMRVSTMRDYIEALGGQIQISAVFPGDTVINIVNAHERDGGA